MQIVLDHYYPRSSVCIAAESTMTSSVLAILSRYSFPILHRLVLYQTPTPEINRKHLFYSLSPTLLPSPPSPFHSNYFFPLFHQLWVVDITSTTHNAMFRSFSPIRLLTISLYNHIYDKPHFSAQSRTKDSASSSASMESTP